MKYVIVILATALLMIPIGALTRAPYTPAGAAEARLRLSWRMNVSGTERCRTRTRAELDELPVHMRTPQVCEQQDASYLLVTVIDSAAPDTVHLVRGGVKGDRPLFVLEERALPVGTHRVRVALERTGDSAPPAVLASLDAKIELAAGSVALVTLDGDGRSLIVRR